MENKKPAAEGDQYTLFVEKFKPKKTTDDCYTPPEVYEAIASWVAKEYNRDPATFARPFYPGGDYEREDYTGKVVVDNPPFSILSQIIKFYTEARVPFFLFAPALTLFSSPATLYCTSLPVGVTITYENGAKVATSFLTNLGDPEVVVQIIPELYRVVEEADKRAMKVEKIALPKYEYPDHILTAAIAQRWCRYGVEYTLKRSGCARINGLDSQASAGKTIFGSGLLLSDKAAAARADAELAAIEKASATRWPLSFRELAMVELLNQREIKDGATQAPPTIRRREDNADK